MARRPILIAWLVACLGVFHAAAAIAHSDLLLQIEALDQQLKLDPDNDEWLLKRGDLYRRHLDFEAAERDFSLAREANPANPLIDFFSGRLALETGDARTADALLGRYLRQQPSDAAAWVLRGKAAMALAEYGRAAEDFARAVEATPRPTPELFRLQVLALVASDQYGRALEVLDGGLARMPGEVNLIALGADTSLVAGNSERAAAYLSQAPEPVFRIERWQQLRARVTCGGDVSDSALEDCLDLAADELGRQIESLSASQF
jgi:tetratricopeptide (TPR) repeat protein